MAALYPHLFDPMPWAEDAACVEVGGDPFFPTGANAAEVVAQAARAKQVCRRCPVQAPCAQYALDRPYLQGIWGGLSESDRKQIRAKARRKVKP